MMALDDMGDKTDGLMAEGSIGNKQSQVNSGLFQFSGNRRGEFVFDLVMAPDTAHKRNVNGRQASPTIRFAARLAKAAMGKTISGFCRGTGPMREW